MIAQIKDGGLLEAMGGPKGSLDAWLEQMNEDEVRSAILSLISPTETLRDKFAAKALSGPAVFDDRGFMRTPDEVALTAYMLADAMIRAREVQS